LRGTLSDGEGDARDYQRQEPCGGDRNHGDALSMERQASEALWAEA
jgi:hypothetical protein